MFTYSYTHKLKKETQDAYKIRAEKEGYIYPMQATSVQIVYSSKKCKNQTSGGSGAASIYATDNNNTLGNSYLILQEDAPHQNPEPPRICALQPRCMRR